MLTIDLKIIALSASYIIIILRRTETRGGLNYSDIVIAFTTEHNKSCYHDNATSPANLCRLIIVVIMARMRVKNSDECT